MMALLSAEFFRDSELSRPRQHSGLQAMQGIRACLDPGHASLPHPILLQCQAKRAQRLGVRHRAEDALGLVHLGNNLRDQVVRDRVRWRPRHEAVECAEPGMRPARVRLARETLGQ